MSEDTSVSVDLELQMIIHNASISDNNNRVGKDITVSQAENIRDRSNILKSSDNASEISNDQKNKQIDICWKQRKAQKDG
jgi:hypothetical protein